jgi:hypothetical protein
MQHLSPPEQDVPAQQTEPATCAQPPLLELLEEELEEDEELLEELLEDELEEDEELEELEELLDEALEEELDADELDAPPAPLLELDAAPPAPLDEAEEALEEDDELDVVAPPTPEVVEELVPGFTPAKSWFALVPPVGKVQPTKSPSPTPTEESAIHASLAIAASSHERGRRS